MRACAEFAAHCVDETRSAEVAVVVAPCQVDRDDQAVPDDDDACPAVPLLDDEEEAAEDAVLGRTVVACRPFRQLAVLRHHNMDYSSRHLQCD